MWHRERSAIVNKTVNPAPQTSFLNAMSKVAFTKENKMKKFCEDIEPIVNVFQGCATVILAVLGILVTCALGIQARQDTAAIEAKKHKVCIVPVEAKFKIDRDQSGKAFATKDGAFMTFANGSEIAATDIALSWKFYRDNELNFDERFSERIDPTPSAVPPNGFIKLQSLPTRFNAMLPDPADSLDRLFETDAEREFNQLFEDDLDRSQMRGVLCIVGHSLHGGACPTYFEFFAHRTKTGICVHLSRIRAPGSNFTLNAPPD